MNAFLGETDKSISKMFRAAADNDAVLCLDEADSLLYDRSSYAAWEHDIRFVNDLLQELERFDGVAVLTTNMDALLDQALERRASLKVKFNRPDRDLRSKIWKENHCVTGTYFVIMAYSKVHTMTSSDQYAAMRL